MPKQYFPKDVDINDDGEVWEFTDKFGDRAYRTWDEVLAIIQKTRNYWKLSKGWDQSLAKKLRQHPSNIQRQIYWMLAKGWLTVDNPVDNPVDNLWITFGHVPKVTQPGADQPSVGTQPGAEGKSFGTQPVIIRATNYWKFHITHATSQSGHGPIRKEGSKERIGGGPPGPQDKTPEPWRAIGDRLFKSDPKRFEKLIVWIHTTRSRGYSDEFIAGVLEAYEPYEKDLKLKPDDWWQYLNGIVKRALVRHRQSEAEKEKKEEARWVANLIAKAAKDV